ncbi:hypothetical protein AWH56_26810 [Anaerobacillus isosaccharinicus]|uniref:Uncharacterized protein n=1 Tax=Anaerobacillus isosaccharinicus TaxID=1532552 RepID=A0AC62A4A1_9BACI
MVKSNPTFDKGYVARRVESLDEQKLQASHLSSELIIHIQLKLVAFLEQLIKKA